MESLGEGAVMSSVNYAEVVSKLRELGFSPQRLRDSLEELRFEVLPYTTSLAWQTGVLRPLTKQHGLSLGDRACLSLAQLLRLPVITSDRIWTELDIGVEVRLCR